MTAARKHHLRDAAKICPATEPCPGRDFRCELDAGHEGQRKDGCTHWGSTTKKPA